MAHLAGFGLENFRVFEKETWFDFAPITIFTGPNSSGKSTINKAILLLMDNSKNLFPNINLIYNEDSNHKLGSQKYSRNNENEDYSFSISIKEKYSFKDFKDYKLKLQYTNDLDYLDSRNSKIKSIEIIDIETDEKLLDINFKNEKEIYYTFAEEVRVADSTESLKIKYYINFESIIKKFINNTDRFKKYNPNQTLVSIDKYKKLFEKEIDEQLLNEIIAIEISVLSNHSSGHNYKSNYDILDWIKNYVVGGLFIFDTDDGTDSMYGNEFYQNITSEIKRRGLVYPKNNDIDFYITEEAPSKNSEHFLDEIFKRYITQFFKEIEFLLKTTNYYPSSRSQQVRINDRFNQNKIFYNTIINYLDDTKEISESRITFINKWLEAFEIKLEINDIEGTGYVISNNFRQKKRNLADEGYGYSQLIPILLSLCKIDTRVIIIEEPESNLHPALQSKLADMIVDAQKTFNIQFIIETHSEYLIRRLQFLTAKKEIKPEDTIIHYLFNPESENTKNGEQLRTIRIQKDGRLDKEFGTGFFDESTKLMMSILTGENLN